MRTLKEIVLLFFVVLLFISIAYGRHANIFAAEKMLIFSTWEGFEADKCASIWLIKRFIDKNAVINFFPKGEIVKEGIPFDTPDAKFRRYHNMSTFESLLRGISIVAHDNALCVSIVESNLTLFKDS